MKLTICGILMVVMGMFALAPAQNADKSDLSGLENKARQFVDLLAKEDFAAATAEFDSAMKSQLPSERLDETWKSVIAQVGPFKKSGGMRHEKIGPYEIIFATSEFEKMPLDIKVVFNSQGKISGVQIVPVQPAVKYETPAYVNFRSFKEDEVTIGSGQWAVGGTLTKPVGDNRVPAVVLVHGSGPLDRDETVGPNKPFRDLAWGLASQGIAVLRYDKRTLTHAQETAAIMESLTVKEEALDDAIAAVNLLRQTSGIDSSKVFVLGHSLGGTLAPRIARIDPSITGFIIMAGMTRPIEDAIVDQYQYIFGLDSSISNEEQTQLDTLKQQASRVKDPGLSNSVPASQLPLGIPANYWLDLRGYRPADLAKTVRRPMIFLQGGRDYQVTNVDFEGWKNALANNKNVEFKDYPDLNHLFAKGQGPGAPDEYGQPGNIDKTVIDDIANWIKTH